MRPAVALVCSALLTSCAGWSATDGDPDPTADTVSADPAVSRTVRLSGTLEAVRSTRVAVPQVTGPTQRMTLIRLVRNGATVGTGDIVAEFDPLEQISQARESAARYEALAYQVRQRAADNLAHVEQRRTARAQAEADLAKALLDVSTASVVSETQAAQDVIRAARARAQLESLARTHPDEERADQTALRVLELQRDRQQAAYDRFVANLEQLRVTAPLAGMVAHATMYNNGAMVRPQEGDQMTRNNTLMSIFDPSEMRVRVNVAEPDGALLHPGLAATVYVDAYPDMTLRAHFVAASPVAASPLGGGLKTFTAVFRLDDADARLVPDLSAAVAFDAPARGAPPPATARRGAPAGAAR